jgi:hypothetical protein
MVILNSCSIVCKSSPNKSTVTRQLEILALRSIELADRVASGELPFFNTLVELGYRSRLIECSQCSAIRIAGKPCQHCGFLPQRPPKAIVFADGDLSLVDRTNRTTIAWSDPAEQMRWHAMLTAIAAERGYKAGWISHKFKEKFGIWPTVRSANPIKPSLEVLSWVRSRNIAYAKQKQAAA